jgi:Mg2+ and Co2+ transporter CorA
MNIPSDNQGALSPDSTSSIMDTIYGPLNQQYCIYFYYLSMIGFILLILSLLTSIYVGITKKKNSSFYLKMLMVSIGYGIFYFQNRLLYSMCVGNGAIKPEQFR